MKTAEVFPEDSMKSVKASECKGTIEITGNWHTGNGFIPHIQVREPEVEEGTVKTFVQELKLPAGSYSMRFLYDRFSDKGEGKTLGLTYVNFRGFRVDGQTIALNFKNEDDTACIYTAICSFNIPEKEYPVKLELDLCSSRSLRTWLLPSVNLPVHNTLKAVQPEETCETLMAHGIPFKAGKLDIRFYDPYHVPEPEIDRGSLKSWKDGMTIDCGDVSVKTIHFLGMIHNIDLANGSWYSDKGDHGYSHFAGDKAGEISVCWTDGSTTDIPLIFGFNLWYSRPWDMVWHFQPYKGYTAENYDAVLFGGEERFRNIIRDSVALADGVRPMGSMSCNARFIFSVDLDGKEVSSLLVKGTAEMYDYPLISAITLETPDNSSCLGSLPDIFTGDECVNPINLDYIKYEKYKPDLDKIMHTLLTFTNELPDMQTPEKPEGYFGPEYDFKGTREAVYSATYLYYNGPECAAYIADTGTSCSSSTAKWALLSYTLGMGVWITRKPLYDGLPDWFEKYKSSKPGELPGKNAWARGIGTAWTRGIGELIREAAAFGYDKFIDSYIDWVDNCLFAEAVPPHWNRIAGLPQHACNEAKASDVVETGNRENDGHGICMWGRYMAWHWKGRSKQWNENRWEATKASVEWIQWQLDNDTIKPGIRKDVLYTESECAHNSYDFYSSYNCLHGIKLAIRMAVQLEKSEELRKWSRLYERLAQGILTHLTDRSEFGPVWHTESNCDWQDHAHKLAHIQLASDGDTYTPLEDYSKAEGIDKTYLEIDINSYNYLLKGKNYNCLRMYGYGQGMMAQAALLLDMMVDAENFINMMVDHCYLPKFGRWISPEGIILHKSGKYYLPVSAYVGQDSHAADSTKAVRLMLGVDDNQPDYLRLVPRFPLSWEKMSIKDYPVLTGSTRQKMGYSYERFEGRQSFQYSFEEPVHSIDIRLGPIPADTDISTVKLNRSEISFEVIESGDSRWIWLRRLFGGIGGKVDIELCKK